MCNPGLPNVVLFDKLVALLLLLAAAPVLLLLKIAFVIEG